MVSVGAVCGRQDQLAGLHGFDSSRLTENWKELIDRNDVDGVIIATPPQTHYEIAKYAFRQMKPVLVEKPFTMSFATADHLVNISVAKQIPCLVGYTQLFSAEFRNLEKRLNTIGKIQSLESTGLSYGPFRRDVPVLWDWGSHDLSMCAQILGCDCQKPEITHIIRDLGQNNAEQFTVKAIFGGDVPVVLKFGNIAKTKIRRLKLSGNLCSITYDSLGPADNNGSDSNYIQLKLEKFSSPLERLVIAFNKAVEEPFQQHETLTIALEVTRVLEKLSEQYQSFLYKGTMS